MLYSVQGKTRRKETEKGSERDTDGRKKKKERKENWKYSEKIN